MKKVFLVNKRSTCDYDEYDSCVIVADNIDEVNRMIDNHKERYDEGKNYTTYFDNGVYDREIIEINLETSESEELCASFNAG